MMGAGKPIRSLPTLMTIVLRKAFQKPESFRM
jgi:hypothetical protein